MKNKVDKEKLPSLKSSRGIALAMVLIVLLLITSIGLSVASTTTVEVQIASRSEEAGKGFYYAEAGLNMAISMVKQMQGDFNDLLAGGDSLTSGVDLNTALSTHGREFVIGGTNGGWKTDGTTLASSGVGGPMFLSGIKGFTDPVAADLPLSNNSDVTANLTAASLNSAIMSNTSTWGGKLSFPDPSTNSTYNVFVEVYDDDDPYARLFDAYPGGGAGTAYPAGYTGSGAVIAPVYKVAGSNPAVYNMFDNCPNTFVECPGVQTAKNSSFSGQNKDFNARVLIRSTARQIKNVGGTPTTVSEVVVDSIVGFFPYPAVITQNCTSVGGNSSIRGAYGGIHANGGLCLNGSPSIDQSATSSTAICSNCPSTPSASCSGGGGGIQVCGFSGGSQPVLSLPDLDPLQGIGDPAPPSPQTADRLFWLTGVKDKNSNARANKQGADLIFLSSRGTTGSQRKQLHGTSGSTENGLLKILTGMTEDDFSDWCTSRAGSNKPIASQTIVLDRSTVANETLIASVSGSGSLSDWYKLSNGNKFPGGLTAVGWSEASGGGGGGGGGGAIAACTAPSCPAPTPIAGTPSRANNGALFSNDNAMNNAVGSPLQYHVFFFDGNVKITGNLASDTNPFIITLITTGYIDIQGNPNFVGQLKADLKPIAPPFTAPQIVMFAGTDVSLSGDTSVSSSLINFDGVVYAREQVGLTGNCTYTGQVIAADITSFDSKVVNNVLTGSAQVTFKGSTSAVGAVKSSSYRILKF